MLKHALWEGSNDLAAIRRLDSFCHDVGCRDKFVDKVAKALEKTEKKLAKEEKKRQKTLAKEEKKRKKEQAKADRKRIGSSSAGPKVPESLDLRQSAPNWLSLGTAPPPQLCAGHSGIEAVSLWESSGRYHAYSTISQPGGPRDGRTAGGALSSPRASKIALTTLASTMVATRFRSLPGPALTRSE